MERTLTELVQAATQDDSAVVMLVDRYFPDIEDTIRLRLRQPLRTYLDTFDIRQSLTRQLLQQRAWTADPRSLVEVQFIAYLRTLAIRHIARHVRRQVLGPTNRPPQLLELLAITEQDLGTRLDAETVYQRVAEFSAAEQQLLAMRLRDETWETIGQQLAISPDAARMRFNQFLRALRARLGVRP